MSRPVPLHKSVAGALFLAAAVLASPAPQAFAQTPDQLVEMAREAARTDRNSESADLFRRAIEANPGLRKNLLREYADQLTYSGKAADAVPLFRELLAGKLDDAERKRAERGLALALMWSGKAAEAVLAWQSILDAAPDDADARKNLRESLINAARAAAAANDNAASADLFARAVALNKDFRLELLAEYAAQLTYSGRAKDAVPLYNELLSSGKLSPADAKQVERGRALALTWSDQFEQAVVAWQGVLKAAPDDAEARTSLREALVGAARAAAAAGQNGRAAEYLQRAIELDPARRMELLGAYAAQLAGSGRAAEALPLYDELLASGTLPAEQAAEVQRGRALALAQGGDPEAAVAAWQGILDAAPDDAEARRNLVEALINAARAAAAANQNGPAADFFSRAIQLDPQRRMALLGEYAAQLTYSGRAKDALPLYDELLASGNLSGEQEAQAQRGRALALTWSGQFAEAAVAWQRILDAAPDDADARKNLREALLGAAREAAAADQNDRAADLFARVIALDPEIRMELLGEYAAQLTYAGRAEEALPLYDELLASGTLSAQDEEKARRGRALAASWSNQSDEAVDEWQKIVDGAPDDADARKNLRDALINAARAAASRDENARSAAFFARAIELDPARRMELLAEYAAQLTYSGRARQALSLYDEMLASGALSKEQEADVRRGRALALTWGGESDEAVTAWQKILDGNPDDADARKNLREALVGAARKAAGRNQNARSAELFARAIRLDKSRSMELLPEYAAQLTYAGRAKEALPLYDEALASGKLAKDQSEQARRGRALALLWSGRYLEAITAWRSFLRANPNDLDARKNVTEALVGAARDAASKDRNAESASLYARAIALSPSRRMELAVEYANQLTCSGKPDKAVPLFREVLDGRTLNREQRRAALLGLALALDWSGEKADSLDVYDRILRLYPDSVQALLGRGNVLTSLDRNQEALESYERAILLSPRSTEPVRSSGRALSYLGRQRLALERLAPLLENSPDSQTMLVAAQAEQWKGRPDRALALAEDVLGSDPSNETAQMILAEIAASQRPLTDTQAFASRQNDGLVISGAVLRQSIGLNDGLTTLGAQARTINMNPESGDSVRITSLGAFGRNRFNDMVEINGSFFLNRVESEDFIHIEPTYDAWLTVWPNDFFRFDFSIGRSYFDDVQSVSDNILITTVGASMDYLPNQDTRVSARGSYGFITDGNRRTFLQGEAERRFFKAPNIFLGARTTYMSFSEPDLDNGYFNTPWLYSAEGTLRFETQPLAGWNIWASGSGGYEWQPDDAKPIWSAALATTYNVTNSFKLDAEIRHQDSADTGGSEAFRRTTVSGGFEYRW